MSIRAQMAALANWPGPGEGEPEEPAEDRPPSYRECAARRACVRSGLVPVNLQARIAAEGNINDYA
jgi:hypothetical protein